MESFSRMLSYLHYNCNVKTNGLNMTQVTDLYNDYINVTDELTRLHVHYDTFNSSLESLHTKLQNTLEYNRTYAYDNTIVEYRNNYTMNIHSNDTTLDELFDTVNNYRHHLSSLGYFLDKVTLTFIDTSVNDNILHINYVVNKACRTVLIHKFDSIYSLQHWITDVYTVHKNALYDYYKPLYNTFSIQYNTLP